MNERIKLLAKQAGYYLYDLTETHECKTVETDSKDEWITLEKFAQLIVRECALLCVSRPGPGDDVRSREHCGEQILQHFGVEE